ncbi:protein OSB2, chloroplastic [Brachypodium distachyon]|uniref:Uncharacterized protein n=1 Tax=Brachypodium distachyon TaxID=15368 RepID=A0A0Q3REA5_BRADI|nr:protein OSB2, chloroplastic [Brachypodium distachyon]KQK11537.1 hypothetical protein BRADI_2g60720v3 [Brachypodium distachyon]KQK11538.1 hypothetical protein BRADI_2g60720v3 [Brachypodium distachyon]|eukprot:XP_003565066.1 protein OSB2, chloroplastic [Brachypodium distachyon]
MRHLSRLLQHRLLLPSITTTPSSAAAAFSTTTKRPAYFRRPKPAPAPPENPAGAAVDDADAYSQASEEVGSGWQMEKLPSNLPKPPTIPFQPRVANAVRLVGTVGAPVQLQQLPDGRFTAVSVLVQDRRNDFPKFWIPVIFQDDLAQVAASHLQENDLVYVSGQLSGDVPPFKDTDGQANIQILAQLLSFVDSKAEKTDFLVDEEEGFMEIAEAEKKVEQTIVTRKYPPNTVSGYKGKQDKLNTLWNDLLVSPHDWTDCRDEKKNGSKKANYPDFKNNNSKEGLWLNTAPKSVLEKLDDLAFSRGYSAAKTYKPFDGSMGKGTNSGWNKFKTNQASSPEKPKKEADLWQNLVDNPGEWWDNRSAKRSSKSPDFKHKETGEALWLNNKTPSWAMDALTSAKPGSRGNRMPETLLS